MGRAIKKYRISQELLLPFCQETLGYDYTNINLFFEAPENVWIHSVPRLIFILEGSNEGEYYCNGSICKMLLSAPCAIYCSPRGYLRTEPVAYPCRALSFSFTPNYIRAMHIDYQEGIMAPTDRDVYFHTDKPLSPGGNALVNAIETLYQEGHLEMCRRLVRPLTEVAVDNLCALSSANITNAGVLGNEIIAYLREHREQLISREQLGRIFRISPGYVSRLIHTCLGKTFEELQQDLRLEHAAVLLRNTRLSVKEIAEQCNYNYANYFIRRFVQKYGMTPHVFRVKYHGEEHSLNTAESK